MTARHKLALCKIPALSNCHCPQGCSCTGQEEGTPAGPAGGGGTGGDHCCQAGCCKVGRKGSCLGKLLGGFCSPKEPMWGARSMFRNDFGVSVEQHERAGKGPAARGAWEWQGRCPGLMDGACSGQLPFVSCFQLGRHV